MPNESLFFVVHTGKLWRSKSVCKTQYGKVDVGRQPTLKGCMRKCLELEPAAFLFNYERMYACKAEGCQCLCYNMPGVDGGCQTTKKNAFQLYKIVFKGIRAYVVRPTKN